MIYILILTKTHLKNYDLNHLIGKIMKILFTTILSLSALISTTAYANDSSGHGGGGDINYPDSILTPIQEEKLKKEQEVRKQAIKCPMSKKSCFYNGFSYDLGTVKQQDSTTYVCASVYKQAAWIKIYPEYLKKLRNEISSNK